MHCNKSADTISNPEFSNSNPVVSYIVDVKAGIGFGHGTTDGSPGHDEQYDQQRGPPMTNPWAWS